MWAEDGKGWKTRWTIPKGRTWGFPPPSEASRQVRFSAPSTYPWAARSAEIMEGGSGETKKQD